MVQFQMQFLFKTNNQFFLLNLNKSYLIYIIHYTQFEYIKFKVTYNFFFLLELYLDTYFVYNCISEFFFE